MSQTVYLEQAGESRVVDAEEFPLAIGGPAAAVPLHGATASGAVAWVGLSGGELFVQPGKAAAPDEVRCNGAPVGTSQWLHDGDVLRIANTSIVIRSEGDETHVKVESVEVDEVTEPPEIVTARADTDGSEIGSVTAVEFKPRQSRSPARRRSSFRGLRVAFWVAMLPLAVAVWFVLTASPLELVVEPAPDVEELHGTLPTFNLGQRYLLRPGSYTVIAEKEGYRRLEEQIEVEGRPGEKITLTLRKLPGYLVVDAGDVRGATVFVDDRDVGETPLDTLELEPGEHRIRIAADRYLEYTASVEIEGRGTTQTLSVDLVPGWAPVTFSSSPAGATVVVDGRRLGTTPLTADVGAGTHRFEASLAGHKSRSGSFTVTADQARSVAVGTLDRLDGRLRIVTTPPGATVTLDGQFRGPSPLEIVVPPDRTFEIEVSKAGFEPVQREVRSISGETTEVGIDLAAVMAEIEVVMSPSDAELRVDGQLRDLAEGTLTLNAVPHEIEVRKEGYRPFKTTVTPRIGFPQTVEVTLETEEQFKARTTPRVIRSPQGHKLVLIDGGRFEMGAPRREPGRRANETSRNVELTRKFYISTTEVTNREYHAFQPKHFSGRVGEFNLEIADHPVVRVTWEDAARYCNWLSSQEGLPPAYIEVDGRIVGVRPLGKGYRMPTEAEWSWVARYDDSQDHDPQKYAWGDSLPVTEDSGNYADESSEDLVTGTLDGYRDPYPATAPVGSFKPNPRGLFNIGGNVAEWVHDVYTIYPAGSEELEKDPLGVQEGELHTIRGGSWMDSSIAELRLTYRDYGSAARPDLGFRIARYAE